MEVGYNTHRLNESDKYSIPEIEMVKLFNKDYVDKGMATVLSLIDSKGVSNEHFTERDLKVALSVVQWFGTNCGRALHEQATKTAMDKLALIETASREFNALNRKYQNNGILKYISVHDKM